jgi:hypothetical protein
MSQIARLERLKIQQDTICRAEEQAVELAKLVGELFVDPAQEPSIQSVIGIKDTLIQRKDDLQLQMSALEAGRRQHELYLDGVSRCEKWLLRTSLGLTDHNTVCTCSLAATTDSLNKHLKFMQEVDEFQTEIDDVSNSGHHLLSLYSVDGSPQFKLQIETQLANLNITYSTLKAATIHVKQRLAEASDGWQRFHQLVMDCQHYLDGEVLVFMDTELKQRSDSASDAQQKQAIVKDMLCKIHEYMKKIDGLSKECLGFVFLSADHHGDIDQLALKQSANTAQQRLLTITPSLERHLEQLSEVLAVWQATDSMNVELSQWLEGKAVELKQHDVGSGGDDTATLQLKEFLNELQMKEEALDKVTTQLTSLYGDQPNVVQEHIAPLKHSLTSMAEEMKKRIEAQERVNFQAAHDGQNSMDTMGYQYRTQLVSASDLTRPHHQQPE